MEDVLKMEIKTKTILFFQRRIIVAFTVEPLLHCYSFGQALLSVVHNTSNIFSFNGSKPNF